MEKLFIIVTIVLFTICLTGISVFAKAEQESFHNFGFGIQKTILGSGGKVIINLPEGMTGMVVQGMIRNLDPNEDYYVYLWETSNISTWYTGTALLGNVGAWLRFEIITTNEEGHANFHININSEDLCPGTYNISVFIDEVKSGMAYTTVLVSYPIEVIIP